MRTLILIIFSCLAFLSTTTGCDDGSSHQGAVNANAVVVNTNAPPGNFTTNTGASENTNMSFRRLEREMVANPEARLKNLTTVAFTAPETMPLKTAQHIQMLLSPDMTRRELIGRLKEPGRREGAESIRTSDRVEAVLSGSAFTITELTPREQDIDLNRSEPVEWRWEVKADSPGTHRLFLVLNSVVYEEGTARKRTVRSFDRQITINVGWDERVLAFVGDNWQWLWTTVFIPLFPIVWAWRRRAKEAQN